MMKIISGVDFKDYSMVDKSTSPYRIICLYQKHYENNFIISITYKNITLYILATDKDNTLAVYDKLTTSRIDRVLAEVMFEIWGNSYEEDNKLLLELSNSIEEKVLSEIQAKIYEHLNREEIRPKTTTFNLTRASFKRLFKKEDDQDGFKKVQDIIKFTEQYKCTKKKGEQDLFIRKNIDITTERTEPC